MEICAVLYTILAYSVTGQGIVGANVIRSRDFSKAGFSREWKITNQHLITHVLLIGMNRSVVLAKVCMHVVFPLHQYFHCVM